jgi:CDP-diacylglycerol--serine O-phosphatidyltransferase
MLFGMLSVLYAIRMEFVPAAWCIMLAIIMDMMDGRVARWTKTTSDFGVEFDSLSDLVSFCVAPAILMYQLVLFEMNKLGAAIAFFYLLCGALRLARFNVKAHDSDSTPSGEFQGLPTPAAAALLASFVLKCIPLTMLVISFLMVSEVPYSSFKKFKLTRPKTLQILLVFIIGIMLIITYPQNTIFIIFFLYVLSGLTGLLLRYFRLRGRFNSQLKDTETLDDKSKDRTK